VYWPAMLMSAGLTLPQHILVHGMITSGGYKMSKSRGNVIGPYELMEEYGTEALRYYLARHISPFTDGDLTVERFAEVYNADLANGLGNLASRIFKMAEKYEVDARDALVFTASYADVVATHDQYRHAFETFEINKAADVVWDKISELDHSITSTEPFKKIKEKPDEAREDVRDLVIGLYQVAILLRPFMPETAATIREAVENNQSLDTSLFPRK